MQMAANTHQTALTLFKVPTEPIWQLSIDQYHQMIQSGILTDDDPVELLEGWLVSNMPKNPPHSVATQLTRQVLERFLPAGWHVDTQEPITTDTSEPEPDVTVVRGDRRDYLDHHPGPEDVALLVEVADASLQRDRGSKKRLYARARIPVRPPGYGLAFCIWTQVLPLEVPQFVLRAEVRGSQTRSALQANDFHSCLAELCREYSACGAHTDDDDISLFGCHSSCPPR